MPIPSRVRAAENVRFTSNPFSLGIASGYPAPDAVVLWTRLAPAPLQPDGGMPDVSVPVQWELATDERMKSVVRKGTAYATSEWAHSVHVEIEGLEPGREYWYRFTAGKERSGIGRTRTAPAFGSPLARLKLAVASCQQYEHGYFTAYRHMLEDDLDLILHVGDYIYEWTGSAGRVREVAGGEAFTLEDYRQRFASYKIDPDLIAAHAACPWIVMWDDHEVQNDYADGVSEDDDDPALFLARRAAAYRAYYEHMPLPRRAVPFGAHMRLYAQRTFGDLASVYALDGRQYRSPLACPAPGRGGGRRVTECAELMDEMRTLLGARQESWLHGALRGSKARWNLMAQGVVMSHIDEQEGPGERYWTDAWNGYPKARDRLMSTLATQRISNPVILSGDIHSFIVSGLRLHGSDLESPIVAPEFATTSITSSGIPKQVIAAWRAINSNLIVAESEYRGYLRLDVSHAQLRADLLALDTVQTPGARRRTFKSFIVEQGRPQPVPA